MGDDPARGQHVELVAHVEDEGDVVLDQQHRAAELVPEIAEADSQVLDRGRRHPSGGLVEEH